MFRQPRDKAGIDTRTSVDHTEVVTRTSQAYATLNEQGRLIKPASSLPRSVDAIRESFKFAYAMEFRSLSDQLKDSYHHVYRELAFFIDDELCREFDQSLAIAADCRRKRRLAQGAPAEPKKLWQQLIDLYARTDTRERIWDRLAEESTCPRSDLKLIAEVLSCCAGVHRALWDEWAAFATFVAYRLDDLRR